MTVEYIRYRVPDDTAAFEAAYARAARFLAQAPQCVDYELSRCTDEPSAYILRITWTSADDHLKGFRHGDLFPGSWPRSAPTSRRSRRCATTSRPPCGAPAVRSPRLYEWAGGTEAFDRLTRKVLREGRGRRLIGPLFNHMDPGSSAVCRDVAGRGVRRAGPLHRRARRLAAHARQAPRQGDHRAQRRRWVSLLTDAADNVGLPDDPEFRAAFMGYIEWGTRLALANSQPGAAPPARHRCRTGAGASRLPTRLTPS